MGIFCHFNRKTRVANRWKKRKLCWRIPPPGRNENPHTKKPWKFDAGKRIKNRWRKSSVLPTLRRLRCLSGINLWKWTAKLFFPTRLKYISNKLLAKSRSKAAAAAATTSLRVSTLVKGRPAGFNFSFNVPTGKHLVVVEHNETAGGREN